jgi:hypothetical protein
MLFRHIYFITYCDLSWIFCTCVSVLCVYCDWLCIFCVYVVDVTCLVVLDCFYIHWFFQPCKDLWNVNKWMKTCFKIIPFSANSVYCYRHLIFWFLFSHHCTLAWFLSLQVCVLYTSNSFSNLASTQFSISPDAVQSTVPPYCSSYELLHVNRWTWQS